MKVRELREKFQQLIFIAGPVGVGKTSLARALSDKWGSAHLEFDQLVVEEGEEASIQEIFEKEGEAGFRERETRILKELVNPYVCEKKESFEQGPLLFISLGGGTLLSEENRKMIQDSGKVLCLVADAESVYERLLKENDFHKRPLLYNEEKFISFADFKNLFDQRIQAMDSFTWKVDCAQKSVEEIINQVAKSLSLHKLDSKGAFTVLKHFDNEHHILVGNNYWRDLNFGGYLGSLASWHKGDISRVALIYDGQLKREAEDAIKGWRKSMGVPVVGLELKVTEELKSWSSLQNILNFYGNENLDRKSMVVALGGGTLGDSVAFSAHIYMRGLTLVHIPTSFLAQVDSAIGGKCGINFAGAKNIIGLIKPADLVLIDSHFLKNLPEPIFWSGMGEVAKYALLGSEKIWRILTQKFDHGSREGRTSWFKDNQLMDELIYESIKCKLKLIGDDIQDLKGKRAYLNLGHTFGHGLELLPLSNEKSGAKSHLDHGTSITLGMILENLLSFSLGILSREKCLYLNSFLWKVAQCQDIKSLTSTEKLLEFAMENSDELLNIMSKDKKNISGGIQFILLEARGQFRVANLSRVELKNQMAKMIQFISLFS